jgi:hypothetical protein
MQPDGSYLRRHPAAGEKVIDSQDWLLAHPSMNGRGVKFAR